MLPSPAGNQIHAAPCLRTCAWSAPSWWTRTVSNVWPQLWLCLAWVASPILSPVPVIVCQPCGADRQHAICFLITMHPAEDIKR